MAIGEWEMNKWVRLKMWQDQDTGDQWVSFWINGELVHTTTLPDSGDALMTLVNKNQEEESKKQHDVASL
jgi:hypothetical protein